jgi:hypothetical protein
MSLPLLSRPAGGRSGYRAAGLAAAALLLLSLMTARAQDIPAPNTAAVDPFSATVPVDATAASVVTAREMARLDGQRRALAAVIVQLAGDGAAAKLPKLSDQAVTDLVASFAVADERMSTVRYQADYTFHFRPGAVRGLLHNAGIALGTPPRGTTGAGATAAVTPGAAPASGKPVVVLPVYLNGPQPVLWEDPNPWRDAWNDQPAASGPVPLIVPLGDAGDMAAIDAGRASAGDAQALAAEARRNGADDALVAVAAPQGPPAAPSGLTVTVRDYRAGRLVATRNDKLSANPGESADALLRRAAAGVAGDVESGLETPPAAAGGPPDTLIAVLPIDSLDDWVHVRARLDGVPQIKKLALVALSRQQATVEIDYVGGLDQLKGGLAQISLNLVGGDKLWRLAHNATGPTQ